MKVLAFNCSPKKDEGNTALILNPFLEGIKEAGAELELLYASELKVKPCLACFNCCFKTEGKCTQKDAMQDVYPKLREADTWVFGTPVWWGGVPGSAKNLIDRLMPMIEAFSEIREGRCEMVRREGSNFEKLVLVSSCFGWKIERFDSLVAQMEELSRELGGELAGTLLRPHADALPPMLEMNVPVDDILEAAREAGRQLVRDGKVSGETGAVVGRELMPMEAYSQAGNQAIQQMLDEAQGG
jgi:putative NADPH-quinone reductase